MCFDILDRVLRHRADEVKRIYNWLFQKTNCYLKRENKTWEKCGPSF